MTQDQAVAFLTALGAKNVHINGPWVTSSCVLSRWTHNSGHDSNPSFGVSVKEGERSHYNCFTCNHGSMEELLGAVEFHAGKSLATYSYAQQGLDIKTARKLLDEEEVGIVALPEYGEFSTNSQHEFQEWPQYWVDSFTPAILAKVAFDYLVGREVTTEQMSQFDIRFDSARNMVVFPYKNVYGKFAGARGRSILDGQKGNKKHYDYTWNKVNNADLCWFNEPALNLEGKVVIVEGQFDAMRVSMVWPKVLANMTAKPTGKKLKRLQQTDGVIHIPDNDEAGEKSVALYADYCYKHGLPYQTVRLDDSVKDAAETHPNYLKELLLEHNLFDN